MAATEVDTFSLPAEKLDMPFSILDTDLYKVSLVERHYQIMSLLALHRSVNLGLTSFFPFASLSHDTSTELHLRRRHLLRASHLPRTPHLLLSPILIYLPLSPHLPPSSPPIPPRIALTHVYLGSRVLTPS